jgi:hypothetical protein
VCVSYQDKASNFIFDFLSNHWSNLTQIWNLNYGIKPECTKVSNEEGLQWKTTSSGRWPQNMKIRISQQPLVGSYSNLKLKLLGSNQSEQTYQMKTTSSGRRPLTEDDLIIWKVEYISNHWSDLTQIWNLNYWDQTTVHKGIKWRW